MQLPGPDYPAPAKLNLFLHVVGRRPDGYHLLQSAFALIDRADRIRVRVRADRRIERVSELAGVAAADDLVVRAARLLQEASGTSLGADLEVDKRIPMGAGLGGGSSDAATTLLVLDRLWGTRFGAEALGELAASLGADVPFFIFGRNAWAEGIGDVLSELAVPQRWYVVLTPPVEVSTQAIFTAAELTRDTEPLKMEDFSARPGWEAQPGPGSRFRNDLEAVVIQRFPEVADHLRWLRQHGAARMTGSGACVFAAFQTEGEARAVLGRLPAPMTGFVAKGLAAHPLREVFAAP
ncbi:MAG TPA: 4-(cytidine 5'-diphospho)-2-C-methyl-D-erythritol kinase [Usitatibacter sp.]|nr:4-(cytidine 5'-diphospho)-2-C-methyl-D-erythritol kinase [Usitatibacter sp.]